MSARREKRLRSLEKRVNKLEIMASNIPQDAEYQQLPSRTVWQRIKDFFTGGKEK